MNDHNKILRRYYEQTLDKKHSPRTEFVAQLNSSGLNVAVDCGCGTGGDIAYLREKGYQVHGFDINTDSIAICQERFSSSDGVHISQASFENYCFPEAGVVIANSSLFFAEPDCFETTWWGMASSLVPEGVFAGDFMGIKDSWASGYRTSTTPLAKQQIIDMFKDFEIIRFHERDEKGQTTLGRMKHWHTFSVVAVKH